MKRKMFAILLAVGIFVQSCKNESIEPQHESNPNVSFSGLTPDEFFSQNETEIMEYLTLIGQGMVGLLDNQSVSGLIKEIALENYESADYTVTIQELEAAYSTTYNEELLPEMAASLQNCGGIKMI